MARQRTKLDLDDQDEKEEPKQSAGEAEQKQADEKGVEYGTAPFPPRCPICDEPCKCYGVRGPVGYYRCENEKCERYMNYTVKQSRPWRETFRPQMDVGARPNMG